MNNRHDWKRRRFLQTLTTVTIAGPVALFDRAAAAALGHESMQATKRAVGNARFGDAAQAQIAFGVAASGRGVLGVGVAQQQYFAFHRFVQPCFLTQRSSLPQSSWWLRISSEL